MGLDEDVLELLSKVMKRKTMLIKMMMTDDAGDEGDDLQFLRF